MVKKHSLVSILLNLLRHILWHAIWSISVNVLCALIRSYVLLLCVQCSTHLLDWPFYYYLMFFLISGNIPHSDVYFFQNNIASSVRSSVFIFLESDNLCLLMECLIHLYLNNCQHDLVYVLSIYPIWLLFSFYSVFSVLWDYLLIFGVPFYLLYWLINK